ncbi:MAG: hypothetical protein K2W97_02360 [Chthoniobacterales bacterium]|nr:hypothetical protein [Chthoniobacterales bacterium]
MTIQSKLSPLISAPDFILDKSDIDHEIAFGKEQKETDPDEEELVQQIDNLQQQEKFQLEKRVPYLVLAPSCSFSARSF